MSNTAEGGRKVAIANKAKDPDYYVKIGKLGGLSKTSNTKLKGFGTNRELARTAGAAGGRVSRRTKK